jgi:hypothetical protein
MLLDLVQQTYLSMANESGETSQSITFYKGVMFLDSLRQDIVGGLQHGEVDPLPLNRSMPESMRRWICRFILRIPHDPENRKQNSIRLQKAYEDIDPFEYGKPLSTPQDAAAHLQWIQIPDFLDWSLTHEELLLSCLTKVSDGLLGQSLYPLEPVKWLSIIRSQFVQAELCTPESVLLLESIMKRETFESDVTPQGGTNMIFSLNPSDYKQ